MRTLALLLIPGLTAALAQAATLPPDASMKMEIHGSAVAGSNAVQNSLSSGADEFPSDIPTNQISKFANSTTPLDVAGAVRSAKGAEIYRKISPAVVLVATKEGLGSGSLLDAAGNILTNWHVVRGYEYVGVVFKPNVEGKEQTRNEIKLGQVVKYDEIADLALVKASDVPTGRTPVRLGESSEIAVGMDVHAIGHPTGEAWSYTAGVISQYRQNYEWQAEGNSIRHRADVIQTQTPINPGNSGGPLLGDSSNLIGVNSFKSGGEGLNFAVSVDEVRKFIARTENRVPQLPTARKSDRACTPKELASFRSEKNDETVVSFDMFCTGRVTGELVTPDKKSEAVFLRLDRNGDGRADVIVFDFKRRGKWDLSFWDEQFDGHWTLVGYHDDGSLKPTRFESYAEFQKRRAAQR